jgi:4-oxalocrotonate tautomerase
MPFVSLKVFIARLSPPQVTVLQSGLTDLMASTLHKNMALTVVQVEHCRDSQLFCGGLAASKQWTGQLTAWITQHTNTADQKAAFQRQAHALLSEVLGEPSTPLYIVVQEVPATDWGYGGLTQAARAAARASA